MAALTTLPHTALRLIIKPLSRHDVLSLCISHRNLYNNVKLSTVYHTIHFLHPDAKVYSEHKWLFDESHSTAIHDIVKFARTIEGSEDLRSLVSKASFQWGSSIDAVTKPEVLKILKLIGSSLQTLHYAPAEWDFEIHKLYQVSSVNMPYPASSRRDISTEEVYSLFSVPTLRQITLHHCKNLLKPQIYAYTRCEPRPWPDQSKAKTSNVEYLSIQDTSSIEYDDLEQILVWPKGLKVFECTFGTGTLEEEWSCPDPSTLINILRPQHQSLEQLSVDFYSRTTASGTFGTSLRDFPALRRISMARNFLARIDKDSWYVSSSGHDTNDYLNWDFKELYLALPQALEELILNVDVDVDDARWDNELLKPQFREWIRDVLMHKQEMYPSLKRVVLWESCRFAELTPEEVSGREKETLEFLGVSSDFKEVGVQFSYKVSDVAPTFDDDYLNLA